MDIPTLDQFVLKDKVALVRVDLNVTVVDDVVIDRRRIEVICPTINYLREHGAKIVLMSHFGRPKGHFDPNFSLLPIMEVLKEMLPDVPLTFAKDCIGSETRAMVAALRNGDVLLLENLRFHAEEEENDLAFAKELASMGDIYINDAFSCSHRSHASIVGTPLFMPHVAGLALLEDLSKLEDVVNNMERPLLAIVGGSKVSTKLALLESLINRADYLFIAGAMANTFLKALGYVVGRSRYEVDLLPTAASIVKKAEMLGCKIIIPEDFVVTDAIGSGTDHMTVSLNSPMIEGKMIADIGPKTVAMLRRDYVSKSRAVLWNGPLGVFEYPPFDQGTRAVAALIKEYTVSSFLTSVIGGGDTVAALQDKNCNQKFTYVSTAGGAFLAWLEGKTLPGIAAIMNANMPYNDNKSYAVM